MRWPFLRENETSGCQAEQDAARRLERQSRSILNIWGSSRTLSQNIVHFFNRGHRKRLQAGARLANSNQHPYRALTSSPLYILAPNIWYVNRSCVQFVENLLRIGLARRCAVSACYYRRCDAGRPAPRLVSRSWNDTMPKKAQPPVRRWNFVRCRCYTNAILAAHSFFASPMR